MNSSETLSTDTQPTTRKSVSFPEHPSDLKPNGVVHSPATEKILSRKPTPFNNDLSESIRRSGVNAVISKDEDPSVFPAAAAAAATEAIQNESLDDQRPSSNHKMIDQSQQTSLDFEMHQDQHQQHHSNTNNGNVTNIENETTPMESG